MDPAADISANDDAGARLESLRRGAIRAAKLDLAGAKEHARQAAKLANLLALALFLVVLVVGYTLYRVIACPPTLLGWQCNKKQFQDHYSDLTQLITIGACLFATGPTVFAPIMTLPATSLLALVSRPAGETAADAAAGATGSEALLLSQATVEAEPPAADSEAVIIPTTKSIDGQQQGGAAAAAKSSGDHTACNSEGGGDAPPLLLAAGGVKPPPSTDPESEGAAYLLATSPLTLLCMSVLTFAGALFGFGALGEVPFMANDVTSAAAWQPPAVYLYVPGMGLILAMLAYSVAVMAFSRLENIITGAILTALVGIYCSPFVVAAVIGVPPGSIVFHPHHFLMAFHASLLLRAPDPLVVVMRWVLFAIFTQGIAAYSAASMVQN